MTPLRMVSKGDPKGTQPNFRKYPNECMHVSTGNSPWQPPASKSQTTLHAELRPPARCPFAFFLGEGSPTKIDYRKKKGSPTRIDYRRNTISGALMLVPLKSGGPSEDFCRGQGAHLLRRAHQSPRPRGGGAARTKRALGSRRVRPCLPVLQGTPRICWF